MIRIIASESALLTYPNEQANSRYFVSGKEPPGTWLGSAASCLGLSGATEVETFGQVPHSLRLSGEDLDQDAGNRTENREHRLSKRSSRRSAERSTHKA